jgi:predicted nucleic acid-binding protein
LGLSRLRGFLRRHGRIALDTSVFIYQLEANTRYLPLTDLIFSWLERPAAKAVTFNIVMTELLVAPYRDSDEQRVDEFYALRLRAVHRLRTPDALQAATAAYAAAAALITNDAVFERVESFETLVLERLL